MHALQRPAEVSKIKPAPLLHGVCGEHTKYDRDTSVQAGIQQAASCCIDHSLIVCSGAPDLQAEEQGDT